ncbi:MAG: hypothetical protein GY847_30030 [Proteobacteria bacterium]|nr:hypothetical protein [Pseudomonadota bacterium]
MEQTQDADMFAEITNKIVRELETDGLLDQVDYDGSGEDSKFNVLVSKGVLSRDRVVIIISGIPEEAGVWSNTLIKMGRPEDSSMRPYFEMATRLDWGLVALNPHRGGTERGMEEYHLQIGTVLNQLFADDRQRTVVALCFSAGGGMLLGFLNQNKEMTENISGMILIDTPPPPLAKRHITKEVRALVEKAVLFGLEDRNKKISMWARATASVLDVTPTPIQAKWHGELPNLLIGKVESYLKKYN